MSDIIDALRNTKQRLFNDMVEGNSPEPAEEVDTVEYAIEDYLPPEIQARLYKEVLAFYPDYSRDG